MDTQRHVSDLVVVGAGIVGLAHAYDAVLRGASVTVVERDERATGASVRNFGHICTTPQGGAALDYAWEARERWLSVSRKVGFGVVEEGTLVLARTEAEVGVLEQFADVRGTEQVRLRPAGRGVPVPFDHSGARATALLPLDLRVDPREVVRALASWLAEEGVRFLWGTHVGSVEPGLVHTSRGDVAASSVVHAVGHDVDRLFPDVALEHGVLRCLLQMLEVAPPGGERIGPAVLTGLSMLRYGGLLAMPAAAAVRRQFEIDQPELLDVEMNLMLTQRPDGSVVLGDTHRYAVTHDPFDDESDADLLLREGRRLFGADLTVRRRWRGVYASSPNTDFLVAAPHPGVRVVSVTSGIGMTTAFGLAPQVLDDLL